MSIKDLPTDYTVAPIAGKWYPLKVHRFYDADAPDGDIAFQKLYCDITFQTQREAIAYCQQDAEIEEKIERLRYERLAQKSDVYPERCAHYADIIEQMTGQKPVITKLFREVMVTVSSGSCSCGQMATPYIFASAFFLEDVLAEVAERVYAGRCLCEHMQDTRLQLTA